uniref:NHL repeat protein n=1 Tax=Acidobacterium capsulatum TaxID=33075 RepID=A0A7V4XSC4_9BACT
MERSVPVPPSQPWPKNLNAPGGLAVDAAGNLYVADTGDAEVTEFIATGGVVNTSSISQTLGTGFNGPDSIATDGAGNFYVSDGGLTSIAKLSLAAPPALSFTSTAVGSTSSDSPQNVLLQNAGNGILSLTVADPSTTSFTLDNSTNCGSTLPASSNCTIGIDFTPKATGNLTASVTVTDNTLGYGNSTQSISLSGTGTPGATVTTTMASAAAATFDPASQTVTLAASVMAGSNPATTGTVTFTVKNGATIIGSATTSGTVSSSGVASVSYVIPAGTQAGSYTIDAVYNPGATYAASSDDTHTLNLGKVPTTVPVTGLSAVILGGTVTYTATILPAPNTASGTVNFYDGQTSLGTAPLAAGQAAFTTSSLTAGTHSITAVYSGDVNYLNASSTAISVKVAQDFSVTTQGSGGPNPPSQTLLPGGTVIFLDSVHFVDPPAGIQGIQNEVNWSCAENSIASLTSSGSLVCTVLPNGQDAIILIHAPNTARLGTLPSPFRNGAPLFFGLLLLPFTRKLRRRARKLRALLLLVVFAAGMAGLSGCGGSTGYFTSPPKTYTFTVTATIQGVSRSSQIRVTVE